LAEKVHVISKNRQLIPLNVYYLVELVSEAILDINKLKEINDRIKYGFVVVSMVK
jgi:hypothetical protein